MTASRTRPISARNTIVALMACVALLWAPSADAGPVVYTVNQTIGAGSATGTITTDGTIGTLGTVDIIGWNLHLYDGLNTVVLASSTPGNFVHVAGGALTASLATLTFNYSAGDSSDFYFYSSGATPDNTGELCYTSYSNCWGPAGVGVYNLGFDTRSVYIAQTGSHIIASDGTPVPEPSTLALFGVGLAGVARFRRHRTAKAPPDATA